MLHRLVSKLTILMGIRDKYFNRPTLILSIQYVEEVVVDTLLQRQM